MTNLHILILEVFSMEWKNILYFIWIYSSFGQQDVTFSSRYQFCFYHVKLSWKTKFLHFENPQICTKRFGVHRSIPWLHSGRATIKTIGIHSWIPPLHTSRARMGIYRVFGRDEPWPEPTRAYFWPAVNKRPTRLWPLSNFFWPEGKKIENFDIFRGNFPNSNPNHKWLTRPNPSHKKLTRPGSKIFDPDPSLVFGKQVFILYFEYALVMGPVHTIPCQFIKWQFALSCFAYCDCSPTVSSPNVGSPTTSVRLISIR